MIISGRLRNQTWGEEAITHSKLVVDASVRFIGQDEAPPNPPASTDRSSIAPTDEKHDDAQQS
jgi:hypothetical protein